MSTHVANAPLRDGRRRRADRRSVPDRRHLVRPSSARTREAVVAATIVILLGVSMVASYLSGHHSAMYANPIYRWRESMAIALSRLQATPLKGYVSYRSISDHLAQRSEERRVGKECRSRWSP